MGSHTKNEIYPLGGRHTAFHAGAWSYGRRGSGIGWQEGASPLGGGPQMKPQNRQRRTRGRSKLALPPAEGSVLPELPCLVCHRNVSGERRVLIVGKDVRKHGLKVTPLIVDHYFLVGQREDVGFLFEMAACPIFCLAIKQNRLCVHAAISCT